MKIGEVEPSLPGSTLNRDLSALGRCETTTTRTHGSRNHSIVQLETIASGAAPRWLTAQALAACSRMNARVCS
jgi:hypothetical protein